MLILTDDLSINTPVQSIWDVPHMFFFVHLYLEPIAFL